MKQLVYTRKLYIYGKLPEVITYLKELSLQFKTVKEFLDYHTRFLKEGT